MLDAFGADAIVVPTRVSGGDADRDGIALFLVEAGAAGLDIQRQSRVDHRNAAIVKLDGVDFSITPLCRRSEGFIAL